MKLFTVLKEIEDPRRDRLKEHSLECIFYITIAAVIGGAESWYEVEEFGKMKEPFFRSKIKDFKGFLRMIHSTGSSLSLIPKNLSVYSDCGLMRYAVSIEVSYQ